jgi:hypothetical protein
MTDYISRVFDMVLRVLVFLRANPFDTPAFTANLALLEADAGRLQELADMERSGHVEASAAVIGKKEGKADILDGLNFLGRISVIATREVPDMPVRLTMPKPNSGAQKLITGARVVVTQARAQQELLTKYGMTTGFLDELTVSINQYETAVNSKSSGVNTHIGAAAEMETVTSEITRLVKVIDAVMRRRLRNDPLKRAAWKAARTVVRHTPKSAEAPAETPNPPSAGSESSAA